MQTETTFWSGARHRLTSMAAVLVMGTAATAAQAETVQVALGDVLSVETLAFAIALERAKDRASSTR